MLPFKVRFKPGLSVYRQAVYAAKKSLVSGRLRPGDQFPSVRALSQGLKINPNTAHKVVAALINERLLDVHPGIGTVVAALPEVSARERAALIEDDLEQLVVEAKRLSLEQSELIDALKKHWQQLSSRSKLAATTVTEEG